MIMTEAANLNKSDIQPDPLNGEAIDVADHSSNADKPVSIPTILEEQTEATAESTLKELGPQAENTSEDFCNPVKQQTTGIATASPQVSNNLQSNYEQQLLKLKRDLEGMVLKYAKSESENMQKQYKIDDLDKKLKRAIKDNDQLANRIKLLTNDKNQLTDTLNAKVAQLTVLEQKKSFLSNEQTTKLKDCEDKLKDLETSNEELLKQIESYKIKEGELIDSCERLSMKNMTLQTELDEANKLVPEYKNEYELVLEQLNKQRLALDALTEDLIREQEKRSSLQAEKEKNDVIYRDDLDRLQNEIKVMRRKHLASTKELTREIKQLRAHLEEYELKKTGRSTDRLEE